MSSAILFYSGKLNAYNVRKVYALLWVYWKPPEYTHIFSPCSLKTQSRTTPAAPRAKIFLWRAMWRLSMTGSYLYSRDCIGTMLNTADTQRTKDTTQHTPAVVWNINQLLVIECWMKTCNENWREFSKQLYLTSATENPSVGARVRGTAVPQEVLVGVENNVGIIF